ncbi:MAG: Cof-type HAD-IIB family hydrolase [Synergistaceae bacterium]|jgi:Cof subfamily protein (haloacid dehalogenase superfamily)|nr:Cof-type HAD-IIB family hydrolase [Synergistaceae bacterium]
MNPENMVKRTGNAENAAKIRMIVCDMDGTLLDSERRISERTLDTILEARRKGVVTTICSGRIHPMLGVYVRRLALDIPFIAANGGVVFDPVRGEILHQETLPPEEARLLFDFCGRNGLDYCALGSEGGFFSPGGRCVRRFELYNRVAEETGAETIPLQLFDAGHRNALRTPLHKSLIYRDDKRAEVLVEEFLKPREALEYIFSDAFVLDVTVAKVNKGCGVNQLARILGVEKEEICVFGDYYNDLPMFREAGLAVAMGNACAKVKESADIVTSANDDDGVAEAIERYILAYK